MSQGRIPLDKGCIVEAAGFVDVTIEEKTIDDEGTVTQLGLENGPTTQAVIYSARVTAIKP